LDLTLYVRRLMAATPAARVLHPRKRRKDVSATPSLTLRADRVPVAHPARPPAAPWPRENLKPGVVRIDNFVPSTPGLFEAPFGPVVQSLPGTMTRRKGWAQLPGARASHRYHQAQSLCWRKSHSTHSRCSRVSMVSCDQALLVRKERAMSP
jgi:hypothetical protein